MKRWIAGLLVLFLLGLSGTAFATSWVYVGRDAPMQVTVYIDKENVVKNGNNIIYWEAQVWDKVSYGSDIKSAVIKTEATTSNPRKYRQLEFYYYDINDREIERMRDINNPTVFTAAGPLVSQEIDIALQYAK